MEADRGGLAQRHPVGTDGDLSGDHFSHPWPDGAEGSTERGPGRVLSTGEAGAHQPWLGVPPHSPVDMTRTADAGRAEDEPTGGGVDGFDLDDTISCVIADGFRPKKVAGGVEEPRLTRPCGTR